MARCPVAHEFHPEAGPTGAELHRVLARARAEEPIFFWEPLGAWVVTRYEDVKSVLEDTERFTQKGILAPTPEGFAPEVTEILHGGRAKLNVTPMLGNFDGPDHKRLRSAIHRSFTPRRVKLLAPQIRAIIDECLDDMLRLGEADVIESLTYRVPIRAVFLLSGFPAGHLDQLKQWSDDLAALIASPLPVARQIECARSYRAFEDYVHAAIEACRADPRDDFMSDLLRSIDAGEVVMDDAELLMLFTINLILAGHETTTYAMTGMLYHLLAEPSRWKRVVEDASCIPATVEEALRFEPPMLGFWRFVAADTSFRGVEMKAGDKVYWLNTSANHDDAAFERAGEFDVDAQRTQPALTFGFGAHYCLGAQLAKLELELLLERLRERMPNLALAPDQDVVYEAHPVFRHIQALRVTW
jgi:cytochrome P450